MNRVAIVIKGGGDIGTGVAHRLFQAGFPVIVIDLPQPTAVRRTVSFCEAIYQGEIEVEHVIARLFPSKHRCGVFANKLKNNSSVELLTLITYLEQHEFVPVIIDPDASGKIVTQIIAILREKYTRIVLIDAILAKRNLGTKRSDANLVIGLGPGFIAGIDTHCVIETKRGPNLGKIITTGTTEPNTGIPAPILGITEQRVIRAPTYGMFSAQAQIGQLVQQGDILGNINGVNVYAPISGLLRGLIHSGLIVDRGMKLGDIDPRGEAVSIFQISDRARTIGDGVLRAINLNL
ncbi:MAG: selenium-dependent molybdenum cofactor biosynthesis protein YqeB [bacterium]|nr:selenium-dependent molybdenum cofactor biosynthesis protein YqeB [bacterium]